MHRNGTNERPFATREIATPKYGPQHSQRSSPAQPRLSPYLVRKTVPVPSSKDGLERRAAKVAPSCSRLPAGSRPVSWVKCSRMHVRYFDDNVVFFRIESIRSPGPGCGSGFLFRSPHQLAKAQCKDCVSAGIVVDADAAVLCLHNFCHDGKP